jgi:hypothetical protein
MYAYMCIVFFPMVMYTITYTMLSHSEYLKMTGFYTHDEIFMKILRFTCHAGIEKGSLLINSFDYDDIVSWECTLPLPE